MVYLTRKAEFSASHYYHNPAFTPEENLRLFGKCNNPNGHGHNYTLEVTVKGEVDPRSGFVVDLKKLKEIMNREVLDAMDHRFLNKEVPDLIGMLAKRGIAVEVLHQTGAGEDEMVRSAYRAAGIPASVTAYIEDMLAACNSTLPTSKSFSSL